MRSRWIHILLLSTIAFAAEASNADEELEIVVGDDVMPSRQNAIIRKAPSDDAGVLAWRPGTCTLTVAEVRDDWVRTDRGWMMRSDIVRCDGAIAFFTRQISQSPSVFAISSRSRARLFAEDYQAALDDASEAVMLDRTDPLGFFARGSAAASMGEIESALADFGRAIALDKGLAAAYNSRAMTRFIKGELASAIADYDHAIRLDPSWAYPYFLRARARLRMRAYQEAVADFSECIQRKGFDPREAYMGRALAYNHLGNDREAIRDADEYINQSRDPADGLIFRAALWRSVGDSEKAIADINTAVALAPARDDAYFLRAIIAYQDDDYRVAIDELDNVVRVNPRHADAYALRAWIRATSPDAALRDGQIAVECATVACTLSHFRKPRHIAALAAAHAEAGDFSSAVKWQLETINLLGRGDGADAPLAGESAFSIVLKTGHGKRNEEEARLNLYRGGKPYREATADEQRR